MNIDKTGFTIWFTGITRSGKSTTATKVVEHLRQRNLPVEFLDSGRLRQLLNRSLGFSREEIETNLKRLGYECKLLNRNGLISVVTAVSPYRDVRDALRREIETFVEVYCRADRKTLMARDDSGLFEKAQRGEVQHVAGFNAPYEEPIKPEVVVNTDVDSPDVCAAKVIATLEALELIARIEPAGYTADEKDIIKQRLRDLGYL